MGFVLLSKRKIIALYFTDRQVLYSKLVSGEKHFSSVQFSTYIKLLTNYL